MPAQTLVEYVERIERIREKDPLYFRQISDREFRLPSFNTCLMFPSKTYEEIFEYVKSLPVLT